MKALVVYDSYFGNTEKIARAIADALAARGEATVVRVSEVRPEQLAGLDLLVVGSPTRAFRASDATLALFKSLPAGTLQGVRAAAFDTRMNVQEANNALLVFLAKIFGYAAAPIGKKLSAAGATLVAPPEGYFVKGMEGPVGDGELERAAAWAEKIAAAL